MRTVAIAVAVALASTAAPEQPEAVARALVPALRDLRTNLPSRLTVEPGTLPPSPFTGRNSTLIAIRIGRKTVELKPQIVHFLDRLIAWNGREPLSSTDRDHLVDWVDELRVSIIALLGRNGRDLACDDECLIEHLTRPGSLFGDSRDDQIARRNELLVDALIEAFDR